MVSALKEKRERVGAITKHYQSLLDRLERKEDEIKKAEEQRQKYLEQTKQLIDEIDKHPESVRDILLESVTRVEKGSTLQIWEELGRMVSYPVNYALTRRLIEEWQYEMLRAGILHYDDLDYIWYIRNLDAFAIQIEDRLKSKRKKIFYEGTKSTHYRFHGSRVNAKLRNDMDALDERLKQLEVEEDELQRQLNQAKNKGPKSFLENVLVSNEFSAKDIETHGRLQAQGLKWLFNQEFVAVAELVHGSHRFDVVGFAKDGRIIIIEVKASIEDFRRDTKWQEYLSYCDEFYFLISNEISFFTNFKELDQKEEGLLILSNGGRIKEVYGAPKSFDVKMSEETRRDLMFNISRLASRWATYGFSGT